jgi:hypothetical protein
MKYLIARLMIKFVGIKGIRHQAAIYKMCADLELP